MRKDLKVAAKYFTTVSSLKIDSKVAKLDLAPNYEEVPKPTDTEQVQQYLEKLLRLVTSNYENSFTHWGPALKNKNVKAVLRKPHAVRHFVKSHMKKDDTTALVEIGKLVVQLIEVGGDHDLTHELVRAEHVLVPKREAHRSQVVQRDRAAGTAETHAERGLPDAVVVRERTGDGPHGDIVGVVWHSGRGRRADVDEAARQYLHLCRSHDDEKRREGESAEHVCCSS